MKKTLLLLTLLILTQFVIAQNIQEICETSTTNGTIVDCQYFNGTLYSTGFFNVICGEPTNYIAQWENGTWKPSTISINNPGHALTVINDKLYIAKYVESVDSNWVYVYDNATLEKVGKGVYLSTASGFSQLPNIYDIIEYDGKIIACGEFDRVGEASIKGIMQWDGSSWSALGPGLSGNIPATAPVMYPHQMMVYNDELYVIGNFKTAGNQTVNGIAKWNGTEWTNLGAGFNSTVYGITVFNDEIIAGGDFTESDGTALNRIAKWNGTTWVPLDFGFTPTSANDYIYVHTLKVIDDVLYIGGGLKQITYTDNSTEVCGGIVSYANNTVNTFMGGVADNDIEAICIENNQLIVGGGVYGSGYAGIADLPTGVIEYGFNDVTISPNPFNEVISINTKNQYIKYEIINNVGELVTAGKLENSLALELPRGFYFLKLIDEANAYSVHKIVKR
ncbi:MAG: T9SS type A sorting domain-containing protein [Chitinophagales bacterium]|nr:T9SS type A sorting domain-containing protein [Bacteroidota bacterium]MCB9044323.1 T9SS type A sorting domain-containing protein [Chitinophagales bacterium]